MINWYNMDCMDFMRDVPDNKYDLAIVDPPYGIGDWTMPSRPAKPSNRKWKVDWNDKIPDKSYFMEIFRISKNQIIWGCNYYRHLLPPSGCIVWDKGNRSNIGSACEIAFCSRIMKVDYFFHHHAGFVTTDKNRIHPCQKPVELYRWLLTNYAKAGNKIIDTHGGSGSIALACDVEGFDLDIIELDKEYFDAAKKRFEIHKEQLTLF